MLTTPLLVGPRRRAEDVEVARQLRRDRRAAERAVRQAHVDSRRVDARRTSSTPPTGRPNGSPRCSGRSFPGDLHPNAAKRLLARSVVDLYHGPGRARRPKPNSTGSSRTTRRPTEMPEQSVDRRRRAPQALAVARAARPGRAEPGGRPCHQARRDQDRRRPAHRRPRVHRAELDGQGAAERQAEVGPFDRQSGRAADEVVGHRSDQGLCKILQSPWSERSNYRRGLDRIEAVQTDPLPLAVLQDPFVELAATPRSSVIGTPSILIAAPYA